MMQARMMCPCAYEHLVQQTSSGQHVGLWLLAGFLALAVMQEF